MTMMIDIVIVNWNGGIHLQKCIKSIKNYHDGLVGISIVVDNSSSDGSDASVEGDPDFVLIRSGTNLGFGKACNIGAQCGQSEFLLFLNPDAALHEDTLRKAFEFMQDPANVQVDICGVQLLDEHGRVARSCARFPSAAAFAAHAIGLDRVLPSLGHFMSEWDHGQTNAVEHVIGAFFLVRRSLFEQLGGFDERFFMYLEDVDFSYRAKQFGWLSVYLADVQAFHAGGGTSKEVKARRLFYSLRSRLLYACKHFSKGGALIVMLATLLLEPVSR